MCFVIHHQHEITCDQGKQNESGLRGILPYFVFEQIILLHRVYFWRHCTLLKFIYSEKATKVNIKSKWEIFENSVAFLDNMKLKIFILNMIIFKTPIFRITMSNDSIQMPFMKLSASYTSKK